MIKVNKCNVDVDVNTKECCQNPHPRKDEYSFQDHKCYKNGRFYGIIESIDKGVIKVEIKRGCEEIIGKHLYFYEESKSKI